VQRESFGQQIGSSGSDEQDMAAQGGFASAVNYKETSMSPDKPTEQPAGSLERDRQDDLKDAAAIEMGAGRKRDGAQLSEEEWDQLIRQNQHRYPVG
jgi:hypothetical protein